MRAGRSPTPGIDFPRIDGPTCSHTQISGEGAPSWTFRRGGFSEVERARRPAMSRSWVLAARRSPTATSSISSSRWWWCDAATVFPFVARLVGAVRQPAAGERVNNAVQYYPHKNAGWWGYRDELSCSSLARTQPGSKAATTWSPVPDATGRGESVPVCGSTKPTP